MKEKKKTQDLPKKKPNKAGKGKYHEKVKIDATFQELINMAANSKKKKD